MTEEELRIIATDFRQAIEESDLSEKSIGREANIRVGDFPYAACSEISTVFGIVLTEKYNLKPLEVKIANIEGLEDEFGTHHWLEHDDIIIDVTADQFDVVDEKVIVSTDSEFHKKYTKNISTYQDKFVLENDFDWIKPIYDEIVPRYEAIVAGKNKK